MPLLGSKKPLFGIPKPLLGVVHLPALPGAPRHRGGMARVRERALADAEAYLKGGFDGLIVENFGDVPFFRGPVPPETVAAMSAVASEIRLLGRFPLGVNVLRSDGRAALAIALAVGAEFIRVNVLAGAMVTDQGLIEGAAAELARMRRACAAPVEIWADLLVKHAVALAPVDPLEAARDLRERALADALIVTGPRTGAPADAEQLAHLRPALPRTPWIVGSGIGPQTLATFWPLADGFIVASACQAGRRPGGRVEIDRVRRLVQLRRRLARQMTGPARTPRRR